MTQDAQLTKARTQLIMDQPFLAGLLLRLKLKQDPTCQSMWTDGIHLGYNPEFTRHLPFLHLKSLMAHEALHCAMRHFNRQEGRDHHLWNAACDYVVNLLLIDQHFDLPSEVLKDSAFRGMDSETVYHILCQNKSQSQLPISPVEALWGEVRQPQIPQHVQNKLNQEWKQAWTQSRMVAKKQGGLSAGLERAIAQSLNPKTPWREVLAAYLNSYSKTDYSFQRPNRRFLHQSIYLPSMATPSLGELVIAVDTSGSVKKHQLAVFSAEITSLLQTVEPEKAHIILCDRQIHDVITYDPTMGNQLKLPMKGGGGTNFCPVFEWVENNANPVLLIYLTDLRGRFPDQGPSYSVLWVSPDEDYCDPPFGNALAFE